MIRTILLALCSAVFVNCGGTQETSIFPMQEQANQPPVASLLLGETSGTKFSIEAKTLDVTQTCCSSNSRSVDAPIRNLAVELTSDPEIINVSFKGQTFPLSRQSNGEFYLELKENLPDTVIFGVPQQPNPNFGIRISLIPIETYSDAFLAKFIYEDSPFGAFSAEITTLPFGVLTPASDIARLGSQQALASYTGVSTLQGYNDSMSLYLGEGTMSLTADFSAGTVDGQLDLVSTFSSAEVSTLTFQDAPINGADFATTPVFSSDITTNSITSAKLTGSFFGQGAQNVGGTYVVEGTDFIDRKIVFQGGFLADKQ